MIKEEDEKKRAAETWDTEAEAETIWCKREDQQEGGRADGPVDREQGKEAQWLMTYMYGIP